MKTVFLPDPYFSFLTKNIKKQLSILYNPSSVSNTPSTSHLFCVLTVSAFAVILVRAEYMCTNVVRALAYIVATKLGIILLFFDLLFSQKGFAYNFEFLHAFLSKKKNKI